MTVKAVTFIYTPTLRNVPLTLISSQTFPSQPTLCRYQQPQFPKYAFKFTPVGGKWPHGKADTIVGNFPNLWFSESHFVRSQRKVRHK